ncbi:MAG TPA: hypothetical protein VHX63_02005 [Acidobacteriaceae bacterium]|jgi:hypothetical protein|nr:hypothetical protein [Acidobacteriaceae bacterium]
MKRPLIVLLLCVFCLATAKTAKADVGYTSDGKAAGVIIAIVAVGVLIGVGVYFAVRHGHSLKGCASSGPGGMQILNEGDQQMYALSGDVNGIKTGDRVRVSGKKKKDAGNSRQFVVTKLSKDYGTCKVATVTP